MVGFPPHEESRVTLANWQEPPSVRWAFRHMRELIPSQPIPAGGPVRPLLTGHALDLGSIPVTRLNATVTSVADVFATTFTDALVLLHDGLVVAESYEAGLPPTTPHLLMSVSKSLVGCVAGILADRGALDPAAPVVHYVPEIAGSGYDGATVRHLLDMRTGVDFRETYDSADAEVRVMERSMGWAPREEGDPVGTYAYLATLSRAEPHGGPFTYRSADTDMLGWVCERAADLRMADLVSTLLWRPIGAEQYAEVTCDEVGTAVHDGGISAMPRDLARFGQMLLDGGTVFGQPVVPASWLADSYHPEPDVREAFAASPDHPVLPGGWYRNQFWFVPTRGGTTLVCLGINGQMVFVSPTSRVVGVKLSSWPTAQDTHHLVDTLRAFGAVAAHLSTGKPDGHGHLRPTP
jgi:CubicO group peptidase (beta-lactamase class C family)